MRRSLIVGLTLCLVLGLVAGLSADMKSRQKTQVKFEGMLGKVMGMFGGKAAKEGVISTLAISGDRMMTVTGQTGELIDLAGEKVYTVDFKGKSYKVKTFAEMRKEWEDAQAEMKKQAAEAKEEPSDKGEVEFEFDFKLDKTGARKAISGYDCQQVIMTVAVREKGKTLEDGGGMVMTSDMWMAPAIPAMREQAAFMARYMKQLYGTDTEAMARDLVQAIAMYPQMKPAMEQMKRESGKLDGTAILTTMKMETVMSPEQAKEQQEKPKLGIGGLAGGLGGMFGRKKKAEEAPKEGQPAAEGAKNRATLLTATTELLEVQTSAGPADVEIPAGFKQK